MGRKIFVSYKYWDKDVYRVPNISESVPKARDYVTWLEYKFTDRTDHIFKGEHDNEDLSNRNENYIWDKLKDRIFDSSITIVLISPNMKEPYKWDESQWIPWEISYSLREISRRDFTSRSNAVLAVILPDRNDSYSYYNTMTLFKILKDNISVGYIPVVKWSDFKYNCDYYLEKALDAQKRIPKYLISRTV